MRNTGQSLRAPACGARLLPLALQLLLAALPPTIAAAASSACVFSRPSATYDLSSLPALAFTAPSGWRYAFSPCRPLPARAVAPDCSLPPTAAVQVTAGECVSLGSPNASAAPLPGGAPGLLLALSGGSPCGGSGQQRALQLELRCSDAAAPAVLSVAEPAPCAYAAAAEGRAFCPLQCARDPATGAVCGGAARGACAAGPPFACACAAGLGGALCTPHGGGGGGGGEAAARQPLAPAAAAAAAAAAAQVHPWLLLAVAALGAALALLLSQCLPLAAQQQQGGSAGACQPAPGLRAAALLLAAAVCCLQMDTQLPSMPARLPPMQLSSVAAGGAAGAEAGGAAGAEAGAEASAGSQLVLQQQLPTGDASLASAPQQAPDAPLLVIYGDLERYWGRYAVKHFLHTANALKARGWREYVPLSDNPRDSAETMERRMQDEFGARPPDVLLFLQDYDILDPARYPRRFLASTSYLCLFDDTVRGGFPAHHLAGLRAATLLLPTYQYLVAPRNPSLAGVPAFWLPHSALPAFELPFNPRPAPLVLLVGATMDGYPLRQAVAGRIAGGDARFAQYAHPGWQPGASLQHVRDFAGAVGAHLACILDGSVNNFAVAKVFEVPAAGALLLMSDDVADALAALGLLPGRHYLPYNSSSLDAVVDWVLAAENRGAVDAMRAQGQALAHALHGTRSRIAALEAVAAVSARARGDARAMAALLAE